MNVQATDHTTTQFYAHNFKNCLGPSYRLIFAVTFWSLTTQYLDRGQGSEIRVLQPREEPSSEWTEEAERDLLGRNKRTLEDPTHAIYLLLGGFTVSVLTQVSNISTLDPALLTKRHCILNFQTFCPYYVLQSKECKRDIQGHSQHPCPS